MGVQLVIPASSLSVLILVRVVFLYSHHLLLFFLLVFRFHHPLSSGEEVGIGDWRGQERLVRDPGNAEWRIQ
jgi:hypothetical protein